MAWYPDAPIVASTLDNVRATGAGTYAPTISISAGMSGGTWNTTCIKVSDESSVTVTSATSTTPSVAYPAANEAYIVQHVYTDPSGRKGKQSYTIHHASAGSGGAWTTVHEVDFTSDMTAASGLTAVGPHNIYEADGVTVKGVIQVHASGSFTLGWATSTGIEFAITTTRWAGVTLDLSSIDRENDLWMVELIYETTAMNSSGVAIAALGTGLNANNTNNVGMRNDYSGSAYTQKTRYYDGGTTNGSSALNSSGSIYGDISLQLVPRGNWAWTSVWAESSAYLTAQQAQDGSTYFGGQPGFDAQGAGTTVTGQFGATAYALIGGTGGTTIRLKKYRIRKFQ